MGEIEMTIYIGYELNNELSKLIKKAEEKRLIFLESLRITRESHKDATNSPEMIEKFIEWEMKPVKEKFELEINQINTYITEKIKEYSQKWGKKEIEKIDFSKLKYIMEFSKFDIPDELFEEIIIEILGYEANNLKMLKITREVLGNRKIEKLFTRLDREKELEKLINKDLEKYLDFELEPQTEMSFEEKYRPFLNAIEEIQTKVLEIKTGR
jgi:hypothetical protein